ncbi:MAG: PilN domain-containing protein [Phycisphaeraceae bacterium]|nr:PilN domain-containing protein [Phycisphaeraceae bacterium]
MSIPNTNLIPASRLRSRRCAARIKVWMGVVPVCVGLLAVSYAVQRFGGTLDESALRAAKDEVASKIAESEKRIARQRVEIREAGAVRQANRAVGEQPDWSRLMGLVAGKLGERAALTSLVLEPIEGRGSGGAGQGRPERLKLTIKGVAVSPAAASGFVLELEDSPAFERVALVETVRGAGGNAQEVAFQVECELTDPSAGGAGGATAGAAGSKAGGKDE